MLESRCTEFYLRLDGWMTCDFMSFSTVFQSYQDNERLIMKGRCTVEKISYPVGLELMTARSIGH